MSNSPPQRPVISEHSVGHGSLFSYGVGFLLSIALTVAAFLLVSYRVFSYRSVVTVIICLALVQLYVQVRFFLHMGSESKPKWNLMIFGFMLLMVFILVVGTLWIMNNLDYGHGHDSPEKTEQYMIEDEGIRP